MSNAFSPLPQGRGTKSRGYEGSGFHLRTILNPLKWRLEVSLDFGGGTVDKTQSDGSLTVSDLICENASTNTVLPLRTTFDSPSQRF